MTRTDINSRHICGMQFRRELLSVIVMVILYAVMYLVYDSYNKYG